MTLDGKSATVESESFTFNCRLIKGIFPAYDKVIPMNNPYTLTVDRVSLLNALRRVGVFVDQPAEEIYSYTRLHRLNAVQLHGNEAPSLLETLRHDCPQLLIIKAISIRDKVDLLKADRYHGLCHLLLFDTRCQCVGGSGQQFSWDMLQHYQGPTPFLLSGGIGPEDAERVATLDHPLLEGIDLNSRFETSPALKDAQRLAVFLDRLTRTLSTPIH